MGVRDRYAQTAGEKFFNQFPLLEDQLSKGMIKISRVPTQFVVRTYCETCDEPCNAIKQHGQRLLIVAVADRWVLHQCPQPTDQRQDDEPEQQRDGSGETVNEAAADSQDQGHSI